MKSPICSVMGWITAKRLLRFSHTSLCANAAAHRQGWAIFTTDLDFQRYAVDLPIRLFSA